MREGARRYLKLATGLALSCLFLYLAFKGEDWSVIAEQLRSARYVYFVPMAVVGVYALYARSQRWRLLLEAAAGRPVPMGPIFSASAIGFMANMLLPFRVGELVRPILVSKDTGVSLSTAFATVLVERVLDLVVLFAFALWVLATAPVPDLVKHLTIIAGVVAAVVAVGAYGVAVNRERYMPLLDIRIIKFTLQISGQLTICFNSDDSFNFCRKALRDRSLAESCRWPLRR